MISKRTKRLEKLDHQYVWHPFTQMQEWVQESIVIIEKAKGSYLIDTEGRQYLDGVSSLWCNVHGHRVKALDQAVKRQVDKVSHSTFLGLSNVPAIECTEELVSILPKGLNKVFYSDSGSEATEIALKMAFQYWQLKGFPKKNKFLRLKEAYHGDTVGAVSVGGIQIFHDIFKPLLFHTFSAPSPHRYRARFVGTEAAYASHCADQVENVLKKHHKNIAAFILEPLVQGAAGILVHPKGYLKRVRALTQKYNVLLILDEVATGFGRSGKMFACQHESVVPDILCIAKGLSGGYLPLSATIATEQIYKAFLGRYDEFKAFFHGHTYTANPLACAAATANIQYFKKNQVIQKSQQTIRHLKECLKMIAQHPQVGEVRQCGFMVGIELIKNRVTKEEYPIENKMGAKVALKAREYGVIIRPLGNVVVMMPSFAFTHQQISALCQATYQAIDDVTHLA